MCEFFVYVSLTEAEVKIAQLQIIIFSSGLESVTQSSNRETKYLVMAESSTASTDASDSRKAQTKKRDATKVYILDAFAQWRAFKSDNNFKSDGEMASFLLESYAKKSDTQ